MFTWRKQGDDIGDPSCEPVRRAGRERVPRDRAALNEVTSVGRALNGSAVLVGAAMLLVTAMPAVAQDTMSMDELVAAAQAEGTLTTIALPHDWCNYGAMIDGFKAKYGIAVNELAPDAGSGDEIEAIKANKDNPGPQIGRAHV